MLSNLQEEKLSIVIEKTYLLISSPLIFTLDFFTFNCFFSKDGDRLLLLPKLDNFGDGLDVAAFESRMIKILITLKQRSKVQKRTHFLCF